MKRRLVIAAWATGVIVAVCALTAVQLIVDVWSYREERKPWA